LTPTKTKIVATIGPATSGPDALNELLQAGVDVCRINCSHASAEVIQADVARIRRAAINLGLRVAILLDLQGPKIRTGPSETPIVLASGDTLTVVMDPELSGSGHRVGTTWPTMIDDVKVGERVLFADGALFGDICAVRPGSPGEVDITIDAGGSLGSHKGINLPEDYADDRMKFVDGLPIDMTSSMHHDFERGNPLELAWLAGAVARHGEALSIPTPVNRTVFAALKSRAAPGPSTTKAG